MRAETTSGVQKSNGGASHMIGWVYFFPILHHDHIFSTLDLAYWMIFCSNLANVVIQNFVISDVCQDGM